MSLKLTEVGVPKKTFRTNGCTAGLNTIKRYEQSTPLADMCTYYADCPQCMSSGAWRTCIPTLSPTPSQSNTAFAAGNTTPKEPSGFVCLTFRRRIELWMWTTHPPVLFALVPHNRALGKLWAIRTASGHRR